MLGVPSGPGAVGIALLLLGAATTVLLVVVQRRRIPPGGLDRIAALALASALAAAPYLVWRVVEDLRYTTSLSVYDRSVAGPVQAFLQPYLLDRVPAIVPLHDTYATAVGDRVPYDAARKAFPSLALSTLFPRRAVSDPRRADWVVAWGVDPARIAHVGPVLVARRASGPYPAVLVARVER